MWYIASAADWPDDTLAFSTKFQRFDGFRVLFQRPRQRIYSCQPTSFTQIIDDMDQDSITVGFA